MIEYPHPNVSSTSEQTGYSVTGGFVYRGARLPARYGAYFYADYGIPDIYEYRYGEGTPPRFVASAPGVVLAEQDGERLGVSVAVWVGVRVPGLLRHDVSFACLVGGYPR